MSTDTSTIDSTTRREISLLETHKCITVNEAVRSERSLYNRNARERMKDVIQMPSREVDEWVVAINGTIEVIYGSRVVTFVLNLYTFILSLGKSFILCTVIFMAIEVLLMTLLH